MTAYYQFTDSSLSRGLHSAFALQSQHSGQYPATLAYYLTTYHLVDSSEPHAEADKMALARQTHLLGMTAEGVVIAIDQDSEEDEQVLARFKTYAQNHHPKDMRSLTGQQVAALALRA